MIKWERFDVGVYQSRDERFLMEKSWDLTHGEHWVLRDKTATDPATGVYHELTFKHCKLKAEEILLKEEALVLQ